MLKSAAKIATYFNAAIHILHMKQFSDDFIQQGYCILQAFS